MTLILLFHLFAGQQVSAKVEYDSNQLLMKNADDFSALVKRKIKLASTVQSRQKLDLESGLVAEPEAVAYLVDGLRITLSRPDQDATVDDLFSSIRHELQDLNSFNDAVRTLTTESIQALQDKSTAVAHQGTYVIILNNLITELKPDMRVGNELTKAVESVRDAQLKISDKLKSQAFLRSMATPVSPSEMAKRALVNLKPDSSPNKSTKKPDATSGKSGKGAGSNAQDMRAKDDELED